MTPKKNPEVNLENKRSFHLQIGLVLVLSVVLISLEWAKPGEKNDFQIAGFGMPTDITETIIRTPPPEQKKEIERPPLQPILDIVDFEPEDLINFLDVDDPNLGRSLDWYIKLPETEEPETVSNPIPVGGVEIPPLFPGGNDRLLPWIYSQIKYPEECIENGVKGTVTATFVVNEKGQVCDIKILKGVHREIDREVIRVLSLLPDFRPAVQNGRYVPVLYALPVSFKLM